MRHEPKIIRLFEAPEFPPVGLPPARDNDEISAAGGPFGDQDSEPDGFGLMGDEPCDRSDASAGRRNATAYHWKPGGRGYVAPPGVVLAQAVRDCAAARRARQLAQELREIEAIEDAIAATERYDVRPPPGPAPTLAVILVIWIAVLAYAVGLGIETWWTPRIAAQVEAGL